MIKYFGIFFTESAKWLSNKNGRFVFYPSIEIAEQHAQRINRSVDLYGHNLFIGKEFTMEDVTENIASANELIV